ncbi:MAG: DUF4328 domain-containing protein [Litorimonas sp.]
MTELSNGISEPNKAALAKSLMARFKWVRALFYASAVGNFIMLIGVVLVFSTDFSGYNPDVDITTSDMFVGIGALLYLPAFLGSVVAFSMFSYRAMKNLHIWESRSAEMSPGWAVGWYFVPIANLWKPYQAMEQIWDGSNEVVSGKLISNSKIGLWWALWIVTSIASRISDGMSKMDGPWNIVLKQAAVVDLIAVLSSIVAIFLIVPTLKMIAERQDGKLQSESFE